MVITLTPCLASLRNSSAMLELPELVIEIPTPRWTAYEAKRFGIEMPPEVPMVTQERAYTAPIWYTP